MIRIAALFALLLTAAIFGFFYAYSVSAMWGLDATRPEVAVAAMQGINAAVRNAAFFPAFFLTPVALALIALFADGRARIAFGAAAVVYLFGGLLLTMMFNVPMNSDLATVDISAGIGVMETTWAEYSGPWQAYNWARTVASGLAVLCVGAGLLALGMPVEKGNQAKS